jgi:inorganic pyrophosphatase
MDDPRKYRAFLGKTVTVQVDRPIGSDHPRLGFRYLTNYGFVPDTVAGDGQEIDAYILGESEPLTRFTGTCIGVIFRKDDNEHKLIVSRRVLTASEIRAQTNYVEQHYDTIIETATARHGEQDP